MSDSAKHVEELTVMRFLDGELSQEREHATREHLIRCARCREDVKELVETIISDSWSFPALRP